MIPPARPCRPASDDDDGGHGDDSYDGADVEDDNHGERDDDDVGVDDDDIMMHSAGALALAPLGGSLLQSTARPAPRFHCTVQFVKYIMYNIPCAIMQM